MTDKELNENQCCVKVSPNDRWGAFHSYQCSKKAVVNREGKFYCKIHDPEYIKAKSQKRTVEYTKEQDAKLYQWEREDLLRDLFNGIENAQITKNLEAYKTAIQSVAGGM